MLLKTIRKKEVLEGFCDKDGNKYINIELIWKYYPTTNKFTKKFSQVLLHEQLHDIIGDIVNDKVHKLYVTDLRFNRKKYKLGNEWAVRQLTGETFTKREREDYK